MNISRDLTEVVRAETWLRLLESATANALDAVLITEADPIDEPGPRIVYANEAFTRMTGYAPEEIIGRSPRLLQGPETDRSELDRIRAAISSWEPVQAEIVNYRKDGTKFWVELNVVPITDESGAYTHYLSVQRETTERKRFEEALREREARFRSLVQNASDIISILEADGTIRYQSPAIERILGYGPDELVGHNAFDYVHPDDLESTLGEFTEGLKTPGENRFAEFRFLHKDGSWRCLEAIGYSLLDDPSVEGFVVNSRDVTERKGVEEALKESEERFRAVIEQTVDGIYLGDVEAKRLIHSNSAFQEMLGYTGEELAGMHIYDVISHEPENIDSVYRRILEAGYLFIGERRYLRKDGSPIDVETSATVISYGDREVMCTVVRDITRRKRAEEALKESEERYRAVVEQSIESIYLFDPDTKRILDSNAAFEELLGYAAEELREMTLYDFVAHERENINLTVRRHLQQRRRFVGERRYRRKDGSIVHVEVSTSVIPYDDGGRAVSVVARDVTGRKVLEEKLRHQAFHDSLTGLPNRALFLNRLEQALDRGRRDGDRVAALFVDLDDFKVVNDSLGHELGDELLRQVADRLRSCVRPGDTVARLFGDEFAVLLEVPAGEDDARRVTERIHDGLRAPFVLGAREVFVSSSIGIASGEPTRDPEKVQPKDVLHRADLAMYAAKNRGKNNYEVFHPSMNTRAVERMELENQLRRAVERNDFEVHYQPIVALPTGELYGVEALARWKHPERGLISADDFILLAEQTGLVRSIGKWVFEEACQQARQWSERHPDSSPLVGVNFSASQFTHQADLIPKVLSDTGLDPGALVVEITERAVMHDAEFALGKLQRLKDLGVRFAIDDYGMGYSCLRYLKLMPVDSLKIDGSFVASLGEDPGDTAIVSGTIDLAHALGLRVVAEGVETTDQVDRLKSLGCDLAQGFHFSEPLTGDEVSDLLASDHRW